MNHDSTLIKNNFILIAPITYRHYFLGINRNNNMVLTKHIDIPSATMELYKSMSENNTTTTNATVRSFSKKSANTARTYINKGN